MITEELKHILDSLPSEIHEQIVGYGTVPGQQ